MFGLMTRAQHEAAMEKARADDTALIAKQDRDLAVTRANYRLMKACRDNLRRKLEVYTGPRERDAKGHFLPVKREVA